MPTYFPSYQLKQPDYLAGLQSGTDIPVGYSADDTAIPVGYPAEQQAIPSGYPAEQQAIPSGYPAQSSIPAGYQAPSPVTSWNTPQAGWENQPVLPDYTRTRAGSYYDAAMTVINDVMDLVTQINNIAQSRQSANLAERQMSLAEQRAGLERYTTLRQLRKDDSRKEAWTNFGRAFFRKR